MCSVRIYLHLRGEIAIGALLILANTFWTRAAHAVVVAAEIPLATKMTLSQVLAFAEGHQPELRAARERFLAISADARVSRSAWLPFVGATAQLSVGTANNSTASILPNSDVDLPRVGGTTVQSQPRWQPYGSSLVGVGVRQELFDFGRIAAESTAADALVATARDQLYLGRLELRLLVTKGYYAVRAAHAVHVAAVQAEARARVHREFADAAVNNGLRPPIERTRAAADLAKFTAGRIRAVGNVRIARSVLAAASGYPDAELDVDGGDAPVSSIPALDVVESKAARFEPEVLLANDQRNAQHTRTVAIRATTRPNLFLSASASGRAGGAPASNGVEATGSGLLPVVPNYDVGVVVSWPIYDPTVEATVKASLQREWALDAELEATRQRTRTNAQQAFRRARVAEAALAALVEAAAAARANYEQAEARFRAGMGTSTELADAEALRLEAEVQQAVGGFELATARAQLARVMGE
jgi:outer membrane protein